MRKTSLFTFYLLLFLSMPFISLRAETVSIASVEADSLSKSASDSLVIKELKQQIQELKMNEILLQNEYLSSMRLSLEQDSINKAKQRLRIDSLRNHTAGVPLVIEGDTLLELYTKRGGVMPQDRINRAEQVILSVGQSLTMHIDSVYVFNSEYAADIMSGEKVIITFTDQDGLWQNMSKEALAELYLPIIADKIQELHAEYGLSMKIKNVLYSLLVIALQAGLIYLTNKLFRKTRRWVLRLMKYKFKRHCLRKCVSKLSLGWVIVIA